MNQHNVIELAAEHLVDSASARVIFRKSTTDDTPPSPAEREALKMLIQATFYKVAHRYPTDEEFVHVGHRAVELLFERGILKEDSAPAPPTPTPKTDTFKTPKTGTFKGAFPPGLIVRANGRELKSGDAITADDELTWELPAPAPSRLWESFPTHEQIRGRDCVITLERRPPYCDRGNFYAKIFPNGGSDLARSLDDADGWPRYYFDEQRAKLEIEAWLKKRGQ
jgi:hypothetical protein